MKKPQPLPLATIKTFFLALLPFLLSAKFSLAGGHPSLDWPDLTTTFPDLTALAAKVLWVYELGLRLVPSLANNSLVSFLHDVLNQLAPNHAIADDGSVGYHDHERTIITPSSPDGGATVAAA